MQKWKEHLQWKAGFNFKVDEHILVLDAHKYFWPKGGDLPLKPVTTLCKILTPNLRQLKTSGFQTTRDTMYGVPPRGHLQGQTRDNLNPRFFSH